MSKFLGIEQFALGKLVDRNQKPCQRGLICQFVASPGCDESYFRSRVIPLIVSIARYVHPNYLNAEVNVRGGEMCDLFIAFDYRHLPGPGEPRCVIRVLDRYWTDEWAEYFQSVIQMLAVIHGWQEYQLEEDEQA